MFEHLEGIELETLNRTPVLLIAQCAVNNYIDGGSKNDNYQFKRQRIRMIKITTVKEQVNMVQCTFILESAQPIDEPITFPSVSLNWDIVSHEDALVLTLGVGGFSVRRILVDLGSSANLLQMLAYRQMGHSLVTLKCIGCVLFGFNKTTIISIEGVLLNVEVRPVTLYARFSIVEI